MIVADDFFEKSLIKSASTQGQFFFLSFLFWKTIIIFCGSFFFYISLKHIYWRKLPFCFLFFALICLIITTRQWSKAVHIVCIFSLFIIFFEWLPKNSLNYIVKIEEGKKAFLGRGQWASFIVPGCRPKKKILKIPLTFPEVELSDDSSFFLYDNYYDPINLKIFQFRILPDV